MPQTASCLFQQWIKQPSALPPVLESWATESGKIQHRWLEILTPSYREIEDVFYVCEERLSFVAEMPDCYYYVGECECPREERPTCYWLGIPSDYLVDNDSIALTT